MAVAEAADVAEAAVDVVEATEKRIINSMQ